MKKVSLRIRNFDKERFLTFNIDNEASLDEELLNFIEDEEPKGVVPVIFEENEEFDTFSYNITGRIQLKELSQQEIGAEMALKVLHGLVLALIDMVECRIPLSYLILNRNYIYIDSDYKIDFICIPLEEMQEEVDLNGFLRNFLASLRFDASENGDYVAKLLTYVNNPSVFNLHNMIVLLEELMSDKGIAIPEDDSVEIYAEYKEIEEEQEVLSKEGDFFQEVVDPIDDDVITVFGNISQKQKEVDQSKEVKTEGYAVEGEESAKEVMAEGSKREDFMKESVQIKNPEDNIERETSEEDIPEESIDEEISEEGIPEADIEGETSQERIPEADIEGETSQEGIPEADMEGEISEEGIPEASAEEEDSEERILETDVEEEIPEERILEADIEEEISEEFEGEQKETTEVKEPKKEKKKTIKESKLKTKEADITGIVIEDDFDEFLAEQEMKEKPFHFDDPGLKIKKDIKINRASIVQNTREDLAEDTKKEDKDSDVQIKEEEDTKKKEKPVRNQKKGSDGKKKKVIPKVNPYLIRINTRDRMMITKQNFKLGKSNMADYTIDGNSAVSRIHAIITNKDNEYFIKDNKSTNHTYVNGKMLQDGESELLTPDSKIMLGDEEFEFKFNQD